MTDYPVVIRSQGDIFKYTQATKSENAYVSKTSWGRHLLQKQVPKKLAERVGLLDPKPVIVIWGPCQFDAVFMFESSCGCMALQEEVYRKFYIPSQDEIASQCKSIRLFSQGGNDYGLRFASSSKPPVSTRFLEADRYHCDDAQLCDCPYWMHELLDQSH